jgi:hypothetical protein
VHVRREVEDELPVIRETLFDLIEQGRAAHSTCTTTLSYC